MRLCRKLMNSLQKMKHKALPKRLMAAAELVRHGSAVADIGCDHGFLAIYLVQSGQCSHVIASDVRPGPLASARANVQAAGLTENIDCRLSDGLAAFAPGEAQDFVFAGMGGELIVRLLQQCPFSLADPSLHFVFQPMTHTEILSAYLFENGFAVNQRVFVQEGKHFYNVFDAVYTGSVQAVPEIQTYLFNLDINALNEPPVRGYLMHLLNYLKNKQKSGAGCTACLKWIEEHYDDC